FTLDLATLLIAPLVRPKDDRVIRVNQMRLPPMRRSGKTMARMFNPDVPAGGGVAVSWTPSAWRRSVRSLLPKATGTTVVNCCPLLSEPVILPVDDTLTVLTWPA